VTHLRTPGCSSGVATIGVEDLRVVGADDRETPSDSRWTRNRDECRWTRNRGESGLVLDPRAAGARCARWHRGDHRRDRARRGTATRHVGAGIRVGYQSARLCHRHPGALRFAASFLHRDGTGDAERAAINPVPLPVTYAVPHGHADADRLTHLQCERDRDADRRLSSQGRSATMTVRR
jgi:hypothetical protein